MRMLSQHAIDRYRAIFGQGFSAITLASAGKLFLSEPPADLDIKLNFFFKALAGSPDIDGIYAGYPSGSFVHAVNVNNGSAWTDVLSAPKDAVFAARLVEGTAPNRRSTWRFYDADNQLIAERLFGDPSYDPTTRPWYKAASRSAAPVAVGPYTMATTKMLGLTIATPTDWDEAIVIGADVILETISRLLAHEAVSVNSVGYVFDDRKRLIVHSDAEMMKRVLAGLEASNVGGDIDIGDPVLNAVRELLNGADPTGASQDF